MCGEIRISAALISVSETMNEEGIREVMRVTSKKMIQSSSLSNNRSKTCDPKKNSLNSKVRKKNRWTLLCSSFLDHLKRFERFASHGNIFIGEKAGQVINSFLVADLAEQERRTLPYVALVVF